MSRPTRPASAGSSPAAGRVIAGRTAAPRRHVPRPGASDPARSPRTAPGGTRTAGHGSQQPAPARRWRPRRARSGADGGRARPYLPATVANVSPFSEPLRALVRRDAMDTGVAVGTQSVGRRRGRVYYGWVVLVVAALGMVGTFPGRSLGRGLITEPLLDDLRLERVTFGWITLWATLIGSTFSPACGTLLDRFGTRVVLTLNALLLGVAVLAMSRVASAPALAVTLTLTLGLGQSALSAASLAVVGKWFVRRIDVAMAVFAA